MYKIFNNVEYSLVFKSLITVNSIKFLSLVNSSGGYRKGFKSNKLFLKQSYMLLTWVIYNSKKNTRVFILPKKKNKITITKSPMAHKTFSQEQFKWEYYKLIIPYRITNTLNLAGINQSLQFIIKIRQNISKEVVGTNLLFLKKNNIRYWFREKEYFKIK